MSQNKEGRGLKEPRFLTLGKILRPHGVRGELRMQPITAYPERLSELEHVYTAPDEQGTDAVRHPMERVRAHRDLLIVKLADIADRNAANRYRNHYLLVALEDAVPLEEDEIYLFQMIGMEVITTEGENLGTLEDVIETGANDVYVVRGELYGEVLIPEIPGVVLDIDPETRIITVQMLEGLID
jgi:16S rRNA processing protein RimM